MRYLPKSPAEREEMLAAIGVKSVEELFSTIPEAYRLKGPLNLPPAMSEAEVIDYFQQRASENSVGYTSYLGAGVYNHLRSVVTDTILQRGEFLTSYTPYQAEISQGTLQAIFEFQTLMCQLTGQEVANASMYDGSTATTEAVLMAERLTNRRRVLVARSVHPEYRDVLRTYAKNSGLRVEEIGYTAAGTLDGKGLEASLKDDVCAVVVQSPNFFGAIETSGATGGSRAPQWSASGCGRNRGRFAGNCEAALGSGHCGDGRPELWIGSELRRAIRRRHRIAGQICSSNAWAACGADDRP